MTVSEMTRHRAQRRVLRAVAAILCLAAFGLGGLAYNYTHSRVILTQAARQLQRSIQVNGWTNEQQRLLDEIALWGPNYHNESSLPGMDTSIRGIVAQLKSIGLPSQARWLDEFITRHDQWWAYVPRVIAAVHAGHMAQAQALDKQAYAAWSHADLAADGILGTFSGELVRGQHEVRSSTYKIAALEAVVIVLALLALLNLVRPFWPAEPKTDGSQSEAGGETSNKKAPRPDLSPVL